MSSALRQPVQVLVYPVCNAQASREYLLLHRIAMPHLGLGVFWQGVTGGVEAGEGLLEAAARELKEETGLTASRLEPIGHSYSFPIPHEWRRRYDVSVEEIVEHVHLAFVSRQRPVLSEEHDGYRWCTIDEALALLHYPRNVEALKLCDAWCISR